MLDWPSIQETKDHEPSSSTVSPNLICSQCFRECNLICYCSSKYFNFAKHNDITRSEIINSWNMCTTTCQCLTET